MAPRDESALGLVMDLGLSPEEAWMVYDLLAAKVLSMEHAEESAQVGIGSGKYAAIRDRLRVGIEENVCGE